MVEPMASPQPAPDHVTMISPDGTPVNWSAIVGEARGQSVRLGGGGPVVNLCEDRLAFLVLLLAAGLASRVTVLPSDRSPNGLRSIGDRYPGATVFCDGAEMATRASAAGLPGDIRRFALDGGAPPAELDLATIADAEIVMFTSGSTGQPEPRVRKFSFFLRGAEANAACMMEGFADGAGVVATAPPYHMFGFELSIAVPLFAGATVFSGRPFYPSDIAAALESVPAPRILISTPVHLRVLKESGLAMPPVARVFSATAPLPAPLARDIEAMLGADLREIFGTTETGSIGWRNTAREEAFHLLHGMELTRRGDVSLIAAPHISPPFELPDLLEETAAGAFRIAGRSNDIVNIAGKRMSLAGMNAILTGLDGIMDGAFLAPADDAEGPVKRMTAFVVAPGLSADDIRRALRGALDSAFIPRRILHVDALPRNEAGKLPLAEFSGFAMAALARLEQAEKIVCFGAGEAFFESHFPGNPIVPGAVLLGVASDLLAGHLGAPAAPVELVSARFPDSAIPGEDCRFRMETGADGQIRVECRQGGRIVMKAAMRIAADGLRK